MGESSVVWCDGVVFLLLFLQLQETCCKVIAAGVRSLVGIYLPTGGIIEFLCCLRTTKCVTQ